MEREGKGAGYLYEECRRDSDGCSAAEQGDQQERDADFYSNIHGGSFVGIANRNPRKEVVVGFAYRRVGTA
jgi:hypothetical protein